MATMRHRAMCRLRPRPAAVAHLLRRHCHHLCQLRLLRPQPLRSLGMTLRRTLHGTTSTTGRIPRPTNSRNSTLPWAMAMLPSSSLRRPVATLTGLIMQDTGSSSSSRSLARPLRSIWRTQVPHRQSPNRRPPRARRHRPCLHPAQTPEPREGLPLLTRLTGTTTSSPRRPTCTRKHLSTMHRLPQEQELLLHGPKVPS